MLLLSPTLLDRCTKPLALVYLLIAVSMPWPIYEWFLMSPFGFSYGSLLYVPLAMASMPILFGALIAAFLSLVGLLKPAKRGAAFKQLIVSLLLFGALFFSLISTRIIRHDGFAALAERSKPLIQAISKYEASKGFPPDKLDDLVPMYLAKVPGTGIGAYPDYSYAHDERALVKGAKWELKVYCPLGILNWDEFSYTPAHDYSHLYGGWVEPIGDWGYLHE